MSLDSSASSWVELRMQAFQLFRQGIAASDPEAAVASALKARESDIAAARGVILIALGKAACLMTGTALRFVGDKLRRACVVTSRENVLDIEGIEVIVGGHPLPDEGSLEAGRAIEEAVSSASPEDLMLLLISGGGSALVCAPAPGISLADKVALNEALVRCGADISEINAVRQIFSRLKGGRLAELTSGAKTLSLVLSDVPGDDVATIASGPTAKPATGVSDAVIVLRRHNLLEVLPAIMRRQLDDLVAGEDRACASFDHVENVVIGSNAISLQRMMDSAKERYFTVIKAADWLNGDVSEAAHALHRLALFTARHEGPVAIVAGGETTVRVRGSGRGGRNQELALRFALLDERQPIRRPWAFLSGGTDGRDGPTDAAGALVDPGSTERMRRHGCKPEAHLRNNDSYPALATSGDLLFTGPTGTNVADLQILLMK
ncbi:MULTISPECIES: DUF4147 domain-containing protein [unclassified Mesorhizobium]|uniref:glycerate kinase type-2 family protein n=1 Tax=unclassified Mesorhizobium TaxID=325217 RepID=UPI000FCCCAC1|nr:MULTISPECIES: DUF4147 domain-containing protein [unclassified Mesorhizobium]RUW31216.1 DUF4147 domain-containing protein [Mesorhizobium sp. M1E.F.Ca.ET.041.01.1.1]RWD78152.1 MAG: DUF4147 domain-containing protein [Mesorhizobium sp.]RWD78860.1 MAG: DUF4147 domain-containing protein [Mesorhizobium sp.]TIV49635.1 MAG: DUF4147 domain-containing protein [Mesorhizobium sp.]